MRRWNALPEIERMTLRHGEMATSKALYQARHRSAENLAALQWIEMDGRTLDFWVHDGDEIAYRPTILALVDRASSKVLHFTIGKSENAVATRDLIMQCCDLYGIPDNLLTDNSRAFSSHLIAGGVDHKFRNKGVRRPEWEPPGLCEHYGINLKFAQPGNAQAKLPESKFSNLSRAVDTRPEFKDAHSGHKPGEAPTKDIQPVLMDVALEVYAREVARFNAEVGRRTQNSRAGESYNQTFNRLLANRTRRVPGERQKWRASLLYKVRTVSDKGQIKVNGWTYGDDGRDGSQDALIRYMGKPVLIGTDPSNYGAPAAVYDLDTRREVFANVLPVVVGDYEDAAGAREAGKERHRLRRLTKEIHAAHERDLGPDFAALPAHGAGANPDDPRPLKVVSGQFTNPLRKAREQDEKAARQRQDDVFARLNPARKTEGPTVAAVSPSRRHHQR